MQQAKTFHAVTVSVYGTLKVSLSKPLPKHRYWLLKQLCKPYYSWRNHPNGKFAPQIPLYFLILTPFFYKFYTPHGLQNKITHLADQLFLQTKVLIQTIFEGIYNNKQIIPSPNYKTAGAVFKYPLSFSLAKIPVLTICTHILIFIIKTGNKRYSTIKYLRYPLL